MTKITAQDILIAHIHICHNIGKHADLEKPQALKNIESQISDNLQWFDALQEAAYVGLQLMKQRPFLYGNDATATAMTMAIARLNGYRFKKRDSVMKINDILKNSSIVDDVADDLKSLSGTK